MGKNRHPVAFISHTKADKDRFVIPFSRALREEWGIDAWLDKWEIKPGEPLVGKIFSGMARADAFVIVLSENSINSRWVDREIDFANERQIHEKGMLVIPVVLDGLSWDRIPLSVRGLCYVRWNCSEHIDAASEVAWAIHGGENPEKPSLGPFTESVDIIEP